MLNSYKTYVIIVMMLFVGIAVAQWSQDPEDAIRLQGIWAGNLVSDSLGGVFISAAGHDQRSYCYYIDRDGNARWDEWVDIAPLAESSPPPGHAICPEIGYIVALSYSLWYDDGDTSWDIRAHKINSEGEFVWPDSGVSVSNMRLRREDEAAFEVVGMNSDGEGGVIVTWVTKYFFDETQLLRQSFLSQRISTDGDLLWDEGGVEIIDDDSLSTPRGTVSDDEGGIIVLYNYTSIGGQRIAHDGEKLWGQHGVSYELDNGLSSGSVISDGASGVIFSGNGLEGERRTVRVFRLDANGDQLWGNGNGVLVKDVHWSDGQYLRDNYITQASDSVFFVNWNGESDEEPHPLVQAINLRGELTWDWPGLTVCEFDAIGNTLSGVRSYNSTIYAWSGWRPSEEREGAIYTQRLDTDGNLLWAEEGLMLLDRTGISVTDVATDCNGGAIFFIGGTRLQHINRNGELGIPLTIRGVDQPLAPGIIEYSLFPNPTNGAATISFLSPLVNNKQLMFFDLQGRLIFKGVIPAGASSHPIDVSSFPSGSYILQMQSDAFESNQMLNVVK